MSYIYKASDWGFKEEKKKRIKTKENKSFGFLWRTSLRCRVWHVSFLAELRRGCWTWHWIRKSPLLVLDYLKIKKINKYKKKKGKCQNHLRNTSVSSLFISLSLTEGQFTFILPPFKLLTFILSLFFGFLSFSSSYVGFMNLHCWQERRKVPRLTTNEFHSLLRPGSDPCSVLIC